MEHGGYACPTRSMSRCSRGFGPATPKFRWSRQRRRSVVNSIRACFGTCSTWAESDLDEAIRDLEAALVFEPARTNSWRFRHELLREVAYELPPPSVRRILHHRVADALVGDSNHPDWQLVAVHYEHAERFDEAANAHQQAAADARHRGALDEARAYLTRAIAQIERATPGPLRGTDARSGFASGADSSRRRQKERPAHKPRSTSNAV